MDDMRPEESGETPTIEVRVYRDNKLERVELCESEEAAATVVEAWAEIDGVECEVDDLSFRHHSGDILEPELAEDLDSQ